MAVSTAAYGAESGKPIEEVVVTGSRIQKANVTASSPVTQLGAEDLQFSGITRVEDVLRYLPQVYTEQSTGISNGGTGTATINLRNLGPERTLVLVNGRRLPPGSPLQGGEVSDVNQIPGGLIERVDVLTGGASSVYGSDAIAGVVNFVMKDDFQGVKLDYQFSQYMHDNSNGGMQHRIADAGYPVPSSTEYDGDISDASLIVGGNLEGGRGNITAYITWRDVKSVTQAARDYSGCALDSSATVCQGSGTTPEGSFFIGDDAYHVEGDQFVDGINTYNYGPLNYWQRPDKRYTAGAFAHYDITDSLRMYSEFMFMDDHTVSQIAPSGAFFVTSTLNCGNPFLSAEEFDVACGSRGLTAADTQEVFIGRRNVEGGPRQQDLRHTTFRGVLGVEGDINENWRFDAFGQYAEVSMQNTYLNDLSITKIQRALNAVPDTRVDSDGNPVNPDTFGQAVCQSVIDGSDPDCVAWNVFQSGGVTQDMIDYLVLPLFARGTTDQKVFSGYVEGDLTDYGIKLPTADSGVDVIFGAEYLDVGLDFNPDNGFQNGEGAGQGGATLAVDNVGYNVKEYFGEVSVPVVEGAPFAQAIVLDLGYRYSDYSTGETANTYKIAGSWDVMTQLKFRASYNHAIRAAQLRELYLPQGFNLFDMDSDPCGGTSPTRSFEDCARSGVTADQYGHILNNPAGQYNYLQGGNPDLKPEKSDTWSVGIVAAPLDDLTVSLDYYDIQVEDAIDNLDPEFVLTQCLDSGEAQFCDKIRRGAGNESLWIGSDVDSSGRISALNVNIGYFEVKGYDLVVDYLLGLGDMGSLTFNNVLGYIDSWEQQQVKGAPIDQCEGKWGSVCGSPTLDIKNNFRVTWDTPWDVMVSANWRHLGKVDDISSAGVNLGRRDYFDLAGNWQATDVLTVRAGVNNLFDREPPIAGGNAGPSFYGNGNAFPSTYDALGRYYYLAVTVGLGDM